MQLEESEEARRHKHKTLPRNVNRDEYDARRIAHLRFRSRSGKAVDHTHKPQAGTHGGETNMGMDHFFLARAAVPQHVKTVLKRLESGAVFSAMSEDGVEGGLVVTLDATKLTHRTRLIKGGAVQNPVCNTPMASSVNAGGIEQARNEVEKRTRTLRSWFEGVSVDLNYKVLPVVVRHRLRQRTHRHVRSDGGRPLRCQSSPRRIISEIHRRLQTRQNCVTGGA